MIKYRKERKEIAAFMRRLYNQGLTTCSGGNISMRVNDETVLITPSALDKGQMNFRQVGAVTIEGKNLTHELKPSIETGMHLAIYKKRPDVNSIVHAHPPFSTSFSASGKKINCNLIGESRAIVGSAAFAEYALMGTSDLALKVSEKILETNVVLMENHGVISAGRSMLQAFDGIEVLESAAKITLITGLLGDVCELDADRLGEIDKLFNR